MRACILAAGIGQRLRPLTDDRPKALVEVGGESFLSRMLRQLRDVSVDEVVIATGFRREAVARAVEGAPVAVRLCHSPLFESTQNSVSLLACAEALATHPQVTFKLDGDILFDTEVLRRLVAAHRSHPDALLAAVDGKSAQGAAPLGAEEMKVRLAPVRDGEFPRIEAFGKGLDVAHAAGESIGVELLPPRVLLRVLDAIERAVAEGETNLYYEDVYGRVLADADPIEVRGVFVDDLHWTEVDTPEDLARAEGLAAKLLEPHTPRPKTR